jgi:Zn-dependent protease with chaperone function
MTAVVLVGLVELASALPRAWPVVAAPSAAFLVVVVSFAGPVILEPLFNRFRPLEDRGLATALRALSVRAGVPVRDVLVADASRRTRKHNAYVSGLGATRRVVLFDTLIDMASRPDVELVVAHELGHRRARHVARSTLIAALGAGVGVVLLWALLESSAVLDAIRASGPADPRITPFAMLLASALGTITLPFANALSRTWEADADQASIEITGDADGFAAMERNLAVANLSDLAPSRLAYLLLFTHPSPPERIAAAIDASRPTTG